MTIDLPGAFELRVLVKDEHEPVVEYASVWNGRKYFHLRRIYKGLEGIWKPGKGLSIPYEKKEEFLAALCDGQWVTTP